MVAALVVPVGQVLKSKPVAVAVPYMEAMEAVVEGVGQPTLLEEAMQEIPVRRPVEVPEKLFPLSLVHRARVVVVATMEEAQP